jgi:hypothetical protein
MKYDTYSYEHKMRNNFIFGNSESNPINEKCVKANPSERWKCYFVEHLIPHIETPTLMVNSGYDSWPIKNIIGADCVEDETLLGCDGDQLL